MTDNARGRRLAEVLVDTWSGQARGGFLLVDPDQGSIETREFLDSATGVEFRIRWMPHRELRSNVAELEKRGILDPNRDQGRLYRDPRETEGRHCFLCVENVRECHPEEVLVELPLAGRVFYAGANFAWIERNHFTLMSQDHVDQVYSPAILDAMLEMHEATAGTFRVLFNGYGAGATIPWHLHLQITTAPFPIEGLRAGAEAAYPLPLLRFSGDDRSSIDAAVTDWLGRDPHQHSVNILVAGAEADPTVFVVPRHRRLSVSAGKGLIGGFEVAGTFVYSEADKRTQFERADLTAVRAVLSDVCPPAV